MQEEEKLKPFSALTISDDMVAVQQTLMRMFHPYPNNLQHSVLCFRYVVKELAYIINQQPSMNSDIKRSCDGLNSIVTDGLNSIVINEENINNLLKPCVQYLLGLLVNVVNYFIKELLTVGLLEAETVGLLEAEPNKIDFVDDRNLREKAASYARASRTIYQKKYQEYCSEYQCRSEVYRGDPCKRLDYVTQLSQPINEMKHLIRHFVFLVGVLILPFCDFYNEFLYNPASPTNTANYSY